MVFDRRVKGKVIGIIFEAQYSWVPNNIGIYVNILIWYHRWSSEVVTQWMLCWYHTGRLYLVINLVYWKWAHQRKLIDLSNFDIGFSIKSSQKIALRNDVKLNEVGVTDNFVNKGLNVRVPDADGVVVGGRKQKNQTLVEGHTWDGSGVLLVLELFCLRYGVPQD